MADYYPLLRKAIDRLEQPSEAARYNVYERARQALVHQLRGAGIVDTQLDEHLESLDGAVTRIEREFAGSRAEPTRVLRLPGDKLRELLNTVPRLSEKLLTAFQFRRELLQQTQAIGLRVTGSASCKEIPLPSTARLCAQQSSPAPTSSPLPAREPSASRRVARIPARWRCYLP